MKKINLIVVAFCVLGFISCQNSNTNNPETSSPSVSSVLEVEQKVTALLKQMTLEEKIGQMNQYNGFWDLTGPAPSTGAAAKKHEHLRKGYVGSMLNVRGVENVRKVQKIAVEETRLGIPLIIGFDVIHGYETIKIYFLGQLYEHKENNIISNVYTYKIFNKTIDAIDGIRFELLSHKGTIKLVSHEDFKLEVM